MLKQKKKKRINFSYSLANTKYSLLFNGSQPVI